MAAVVIPIRLRSVSTYWYSARSSSVPELVGAAGGGEATVGAGGLATGDGRATRVRFCRAVFLLAKRHSSLSVTQFGNHHDTVRVHQVGVTAYERQDRSLRWLQHGQVRRLYDKLLLHHIGEGLAP